MSPMSRQVCRQPTAARSGKAAVPVPHGGGCMRALPTGAFAWLLAASGASHACCSVQEERRDQGQGEDQGQAGAVP